MTGALVDMIAARTPRERLLLAILLIAALPLLVFATVVLPLQQAREDAARSLTDAEALNHWVVARVADAPPALTPKANRTPIGSTGIEDSLIAAGLRQDVTDLGQSDDGIIQLRFDEVTFTTLATWISRQAPEWGYDLSTFRFEAHTNSGKVSASLTLSPSVDQ